MSKQSIDEANQKLVENMSELMDLSELRAALKKCPEWEIENKSIIRTVEFDEFSDAIDFVDGLAEIIEEAHHYPEILIRYNKVTLRLTTYDVDGVTERDLQLAHRIDNLID